MRAAGTTPPASVREKTEQLYDLMSRVAHNRRSSCVDAVPIALGQARGLRQREATLRMSRAHADELRHLFSARRAQGADTCLT